MWPARSEKIQRFEKRREETKNSEESLNFGVRKVCVAIPDAVLCEESLGDGGIHDGSDCTVLGLLASLCLRRALDVGTCDVCMAELCDSVVRGFADAGEEEKVSCSLDL